MFIVVQKMFQYVILKSPDMDFYQCMFMVYRSIFTVVPAKDPYKILSHIICMYGWPYGALATGSSHI